eukprot:12410166-Prorocentrum_lima.AAC.1
MGRTAVHAGQVDGWVEFAVSELMVEHPLGPTVLTSEDVDKRLSALDAQLGSRTYLVGEVLSLADLVVSTALRNLFDAFASDISAAYPNLAR